MPGFVVKLTVGASSGIMILLCVLDTTVSGDILLQILESPLSEFTEPKPIIAPNFTSMPNHETVSSYDSFENDPLVKKSRESRALIKKMQQELEAYKKQIEKEHAEVDKTIAASEVVIADKKVMDRIESAMFSGQDIPQDEEAQRVLRKYRMLAPEKLPDMTLGLKDLLVHTQNGFRDLYDPKRKKLNRSVSVEDTKWSGIYSNGDRLIFNCGVAGDVGEQEALKIYETKLAEIKQVMIQDGGWVDKGGKLLSFDSKKGRVFSKDGKYLMTIDFSKDMDGVCNVTISTQVKTARR